MEKERFSLLFNNDSSYLHYFTILRTAFTFMIVTDEILIPPFGYGLELLACTILLLPI